MERRKPFSLTAVVAIVCMLGSAALPVRVRAAGDYNFVYGDDSGERTASDPHGRQTNPPASTTEVAAATSVVGLVVGLCLWPVCGPLAAVIGPAVGFGLGQLLMSTYLCQSVRPRVAQFVGDAKAAVIGAGATAGRTAVDLGTRARATGSQAVTYVGDATTDLYGRTLDRFGGPSSTADLSKRRRQAYLELQAAITTSPPNLKRAQQLRNEMAIIDRSLAMGH